MVNFPRNIKRLQKFRRCCFSGDNALEFECVIVFDWFVCFCYCMISIEMLKNIRWMFLSDYRRFATHALNARWYLENVNFSIDSILSVTTTLLYALGAPSFGKDRAIPELTPGIRFFWKVQFRKFGNLYCHIQIDIYTCQCNTPSKLHFVKLV